MTKRYGAYGFTLDRFQVDANAAFDAGESVLVAAPTGSGKTVIAEHAIDATLARGQASFYTSPIKALANQKFRDFGRRFGREAVGLLTGDVTVNGDAPVVVMTTEVLRNMLYEGSGRLRGLGCVVLDEVHYLQDRERGPVWEEVLLNLPPEVRTISLSATVSNLDEFVAWLRSVRGPTTLVVERERPVPLQHFVAAADRERGSLEIEPLLEGGRLAAGARRFRDPRSGPKRVDRGAGDRRRNRGGRHRSVGSRRWAPPRRTELSRHLVGTDLSPLIWFIFSRAGCDEAVEQCVRSGVRFTDDDQRRRLREILEDRTADVDDDAWFSLGLDEWQRAFERGIASHHAGLIPAVKEAVEVGFAEGLVSVVFATETLALGVNLPARTVVLERLIKFDGEDHKPLTPMEFTQLTGRAGRRGLDEAGTAISCWNTRLGVEQMASLAASTDYALRSAFAPNYNMVANLMRRADRATARHFVARSFAQFQIDRSAVRHDARTLDLERQIESARAAAVCERGDLQAWIESTRAGRTADDEELGRLRPGSVLDTRGGAIVVSVAHRSGGVVVRAVTAAGETISIRSGQLPSPIAEIGEVPLPRGLGPTSSETTAWAQDELRRHWRREPQGVGGCPALERHLDALREVDLLERRLERGRTAAQRRAGRLERRFDAVAEILHRQGFAEDWELSGPGQLLTRVHGECEIVLAEALADGVLEDLHPPGFAAVISCLAYEQRGRDALPMRWPSKPVRRAANHLSARARLYRALELDAIDETLTREPDPGMVEIVHGWATGRTLDEVLPDTMSGGEFVRSMRQVIDLCRQISQSGATAAEVAAEAIFCLDHGVVRNRDLFGEAGDDRDQAVDRGDADAD